jgi:replicative DNA helicase
MSADLVTLERRLLGVILRDPEALVVVRTMVRATDFTRDAHKHIFAMMLELRRRFRDINLETVTNGLRLKGTLDRCGGPAYLAALTEGLSDGARAFHVARLVSERAIRRHTVDAKPPASVEEALGLEP